MGGINIIKLKNCKRKDFLGQISDKKLYCFGSGSMAEWLLAEVSQIHVAEHIEAFVDNDVNKEGASVLLDGLKIPVISFNTFLQKRDKDTILLITSMYYQDIIAQMDRETVLDGMACYIWVFMEEEKNLLQDTEDSGTPIIPKKIHYCWFGGRELPEEYRRYIETWKKYCPDYEIIKWDESNYDCHKVLYTRQAYEAEKWAFVSDYARLDIIYKYGGIYLDTDVEVIRSLDDLLGNRMFCGFEQGNCINTGLGFGAVEGFSPLGALRDRYYERSFFKTDGSLNLTPCTNYQTQDLVSWGLKRNGNTQLVNCIKIYPRTVLAPLDFYGVQDFFSENTYTIHHYAATWFTEGRSRTALLQNNEKIKQRMKNNV